MEKKYELTNDTKLVDCRALSRIRALKSFSTVVKGDLGGWVESDANLSQDGNCWVYDNAVVYGDARVRGNAKVSDTARVLGTANVFGNAWVSERAEVFGNTRVDGHALVCGASYVYGQAHITDYAKVYGNAMVHSHARVYNQAKVNCTLVGYAGGEKVYREPPIYIQGSRFPIGVCDGTLVRSGCITKPIEWWEENITRCAEKHNYPPENVKEYKIYVKLIRVWLDAQE